MTDTSTADELPPQTNGINNGLLDEDEKERMRIRPVEIDADVREMERRKRVENIMNSRLFREELERIIETQMRDGSGPSATGLLQQISDMVGVSKQAGNVFKNSNCVIPINDIRGIESMGYAKGEKILRCKLAAVFRLIDLYGWTQSPNTLITARLNQEEEQFLVNPYGMLFHEVTASSLIKVDMQGAVIEQGTTNFSVNVTAFSLHGAVHAARPDLRCIIHVRTPSVVAVSALKTGLLPLSQESVVVGEASAHAYLGGLLDADEKDKLARNLGPVNKVLLLTNQGALCCGETMEEAFFNARNTILASETQLKLLPVGVDNLVLLNDEARKKIYDAAHRAPESTPRPDQPSVLEGKVERKWRVGGVEFEALMRMMDNAGFRTGYIYRHPLVKGEPPKPRNDVEVPPAVSSLGYLLEEEELYRQGLWKKLEGGRKGNDRSRWLNSPNVYQKVEILETGTPDPKKITKWVADASPSHSSTPMKIDVALQFVPQGTNPKEFKQKQQQIKDYRRADKISAGPQSHILEGVTWEEARKMQDAVVTQTGDQVVLMGAASKGIIQRGHQHNATVYKSPYAKNPFDCVTDEELEDYKKVVEKKTKGEYDTDYSESEGLSSAQINKRLDNIHLRSPTSMTSETEEESRDEPRILRIETTTAPKPSQPEVVLSDVEHPVEQFLRTERTPVNNYRSSETLTNNFYRTNSHAGLPKGSYLSPNPVHFHISRLTTTEEVQTRRPLLITNNSFHRLLGQNNNRGTFKDNVKISLNFDRAHSASMDMSLTTLRAFILPFANALNVVPFNPVVHNSSSQTSYNIKQNVNYTPLYLNVHSNTLHVDSPDSFEQNVLKTLHDSVMAESLSSGEELKEFDDNDRLDICEGLAEIPIDLAENFNFDVNDGDIEKCVDSYSEKFSKISKEFSVGFDYSKKITSGPEDLKGNDGIFEEVSGESAVGDGCNDNFAIGKQDDFKGDTFEQNKVLPLNCVPEEIDESSLEINIEDLLDAEGGELAVNPTVAQSTDKCKDSMNQYGNLQNEIVMPIQSKTLSLIREENEDLDVEEDFNDDKDVADASGSTSKTYTVSQGQKTEVKKIELSTQEQKSLELSSSELDPNGYGSNEKTYISAKNLPLIIKESEEHGREYKTDNLPPKPNHALSKDGSKQDEIIEISPEFSDLNTEQKSSEISSSIFDRNGSSSDGKTHNNVEHIMTQELGKENLDNQSPNEMVMQHKNDLSLISEEGEENDKLSLKFDAIEEINAIFEEEISIPEESTHYTSFVTADDTSDIQATTNTLKEVRTVLQYFPKSFDEGIEDTSLISRTRHDTVDDRVKQLGTIIKDYVIKEGFELRELVLFPELPNDNHLSKLISELRKVFSALFPEGLFPGQRSDLRIDIGNYVLDMLTVDQRFEDSGSSNNSFNISDKMFTISEYVSEILNVFFGAIYSDDDFLMFSERVSDDTIAKSTPSGKKSIKQDESNNTVTTFKKITTKSSEVLWISMTPARAPAKPSSFVKRVGKTLGNVDETPGLDFEHNNLALSTPKDKFCVNLFNSNLSESFAIDNNCEEIPNSIEDYEVLGIISSTDCESEKEDAKNEKLEASNRNLSEFFTIDSKSDQASNSIADYDILGIISNTDCESEKEDAKNEQSEAPDNNSSELFTIDSKSDQASNSIADYDILGVISSSDCESEKEDVRNEQLKPSNANIVVSNEIQFFRTKSFTTDSFALTTGVIFANNENKENFTPPDNEGENTVNGDQSDAHMSTLSQSSKEDRSISEGSPKKDKKKKKGLRTPSFLKKKKEKKSREA